MCLQPRWVSGHCEQCKKTSLNRSHMFDSVYIKLLKCLNNRMENSGCQALGMVGLGGRNLAI